MIGDRSLPLKSFKKGVVVKVRVDHMTELLHDMGLLNADDSKLRVVHMIGSVNRVSKGKVEVNLPAAEESFLFDKKYLQLQQRGSYPRLLYVAFAEDVKRVKGLILDCDVLPPDYFFTLKSAELACAGIKLMQDNVPLASDAASATRPDASSSTTPLRRSSRPRKSRAPVSAPAVSSPDPTPTAVKPAQSATGTPSTTTPKQRPRRRRRRRKINVDESDDMATDASDSNEEDGIVEAGIFESDHEVSDDFITDDDVEAESDHDDMYLEWPKPKTWEKEDKTPLERMCGEARWFAPGKRDACPSRNIGPRRECTFEVDGNRTASDLLLDALPVRRYWIPLANQSWKYAEDKSQTQTTPTSRPVKREWFTAANFLRVLACVIMRGLVNCRDDPEFFNGQDRGGYHTTGAKDVTGLSLLIYQQLLRYMHLVDNTKKVPSSSDDYDKVFHVRPLIKLLQETFFRWCHSPSKNNSMDEGGIPSRHRWLRTFNPSKPHKYFIEILMGCDSVTNYCWGFLVTESALKTVRNRHREGRNKHRYVRVTHYQHEYNEVEREVQDELGSCPAQMMWFARTLRSFDPDHALIYRLFSDRRWDSLPGIVLAWQNHKVSFTATVMINHRYHIIRNWKKVVKKSKTRSKRGKYRSARTVIDGVALTEVLWNDSTRIGAVSADLGSERCEVARRTGRHIVAVPCPRMHFVRNLFFRGVDQNDQLRMCKWKMVFKCKNKTWPKLVNGLYELCIVNIYIIKRTFNRHLKQDDFRWNLVFGLVEKAKQLEAESAAQVATTSTPSVCEPESVDRFDGKDVHHLDFLPEYVTPEVAEINQRIADDNPTRRKLNKKPRQRDVNRQDKKVHNPLFTSASTCLVCRHQYGKRRETMYYCRECNVDDFTHWPRTNRATGFAKQFHPRLCSRECFDFFHTTQVQGLDYDKKRKRASSTSTTKKIRKKITREGVGSFDV